MGLALPLSSPVLVSLEALSPARAPGHPTIPLPRVDTLGMAYPHSFLRLVVSGTLWSSEAFTWTLALSDQDDLMPEGAPETVPASIVTAVQAFHATTGMICNEARLTQIKLNRIGLDGRYISQSETVLHDFAPPGIPGASSSPVAPQIALAVSLVTEKRRGPANAGRFYLPLPAYPPAAGGVITTANATAVATAATTLLNALNTAVPAHRVVVMSNVGGGASEQVTRVRVGRVLDTMRSRRTSLPEGYVVGAELTLPA